MSTVHAPTDSVPARRLGTGNGAASPFGAVYHVECRKLARQTRVRAVLAFLLVVPWVYIGLILH